MPSTKENLRRLYNSAFTYYSLPDYETFERDMQDEGKRKRFYQNMQKHYQLPDYDEFSSDIGITRKPVSAQQPAKPTVASTPKPQAPTTAQTTTPKQQEVKPATTAQQPAKKQQGWKPTAVQMMGIQMQMDDLNRHMQQSREQLNQTISNIRKSAGLDGGPVQRKFNPTSGQWETKYYTANGKEVGNMFQASVENLKARDQWESTTPEGRKHREQRIEEDYERNVGAVMDKYDPDNTAEQVWQLAGQREAAAKEKHNNEIWNDYAALGGGREMRMMQTGEMRTSNLADHLTYHELQRMADESWNMLGKKKQQEIIGSLQTTLKNRYPQATDEQLQQAATELARHQSDQRMFNLAVAKNAPSSATEFFFRKMAGMNALSMIAQAAARSKAGTTGDMEARDVAEQQFADKSSGNYWTGVAGNVAGFVFDPLTLLSAGTASTATKGALWLGGKALGEAAMRKGATTLGGRLALGAIAGSANLGTYEAGSEALNQLKWGGHIDGVDENGHYQIGDYSAGAVGKQALHGTLMGATTGVIAPMLGNVSDKLVRATESTAGKLGIRAGEIGVSTLAEGTIFSAPEFISTYNDYGNLINSLSDKESPNYIADEQQRAEKIAQLKEQRGDAMMDVWTDNMAMMAGFKVQGMLKSAPARIAQLASSKGTKASFETRLRSILDGHEGLALTKDEQRELDEGGYTDLKDLTEDYKRYAENREQFDKQHPETSRADRMLEQGEDASIPYNRFVELMQDGSISEAARAKMYYYLTGKTLPMSTVMGAQVSELKDEDGNTKGYVVQSYGANGVITSREFGDKQRAETEQKRIMRQAELNTIDVGERHYDWQYDNKKMYAACNQIAEQTGAPVNLLFELMKRKPEEMTEVEVKWANEIMERYKKLGDDFDLPNEHVKSSASVRKEIGAQFGVDVDKAIRKEPNRRSEQEQKALQEYAKALFPDEARKQQQANERGEEASDNGTPENPEPPQDGPTGIAGLLSDDGNTNPLDAAHQRGREAKEDERRDIAIERQQGTPEAEEAWNGVLESINEEADYTAAQLREVNKPTLHKDGGQHPARLKEKDEHGNDKFVYIVDGNVTMLPDGTMVDPDKSDKSIVIYDPATGERKMIDPTLDGGILSLDGVVSAEDVEANVQQRRDLYAQARINDALGRINLHPGQQITLPSGEEAVVMAFSQDGEDITVALADGTQTNIKRSDLQKISDEAAIADYNKRHGIEPEQQSGNEQQPAAEQAPEQPAAPQAPTGTTDGAPADYTEGIELTVRDEDGTEKPAMVMGRVRFENGQFVPDANGNIVEYLMDGQPHHDHIGDLNKKVVNHTMPQAEQPAAQEQAPAQPEQPAEPQKPIAEQPQSDEEKVIKQGIQGVGEGLGEAMSSTAAIVRENDINEWLQKPDVAEAMKKYGEGAQSIDELVQRALADNPNEETKKALNDILRFDSSKNILAGYLSAAPAAPAVPATEQPTAEGEGATPAAPEPMPMKADGEEDYYATTPERAHAYIYNEAGLPHDVATGIVTANYNDAAKELAKAKAASLPKVGKSIKQYKEAMEKRQQKIDEAQKAVDYWSRVREIQNDVNRKQAEERAAQDAARHEQAVQQAQADFEARKKAEAERKETGNENPMPVITDKWNSASKVDGNKDEIVLPNGEHVKGHYVLHESGASSPSHNPETWQKTDGFPMDANDNSVNDRDYERDKDAQKVTEQIAQNYDQRALQTPVVVSQDGVVLSGNGRTMAGELAAKAGTDGAYIDYLKEYAGKYGFTPEQVGAMQHPRVSFVPDEQMPYTAETFAKFNQQEMKSQNKTEAAVKLGKTVDDDTFGKVVKSINSYDTLGDFYNDPQASLGAVYALHNAGVIPQAQIAEMVDGARGQERLSAVGREMLENMLIGKAFGNYPDAVRMLTAIPSMRQSVITALGEISDNIALGKDWSLQEELAKAVKLCYDARNAGYQFGDIVSVHAKQGVLFADPDQLQSAADFNDVTMLMLADLLNDKRVTMLKKSLQMYNDDARNSASGQLDMFSNGIRSREEILRDVIKFINHGRKDELAAAQAAAVERRKAESVPENGTPPQGNNEPAPAGGDAQRQDNLAQAQKLKYKVSDEIDENGIPFVLSPSGDVEFGRITADTGLQEAPILLSEGMITDPETNAGYGLIHIEARHGDQIRNAGYGSVLDFISEVARNYDIIREGKDRDGNQTFVLQLTDKHNNTLMVELSGDGSYWNINTAGVFKTSYGAKRKVVYNRHTTAKQPAETAEASLPENMAAQHPRPA